jgi:hypothetical protein
MTLRVFVVLMAAFGVAAGSPKQAHAHDLRGIVKLPGDAVIVQASFSDETPAQDANVRITDASGAEVAAGKTDETGVCRFGKLAPGKYTAVIESIGHRDAIDFEVSGSSDLLEFSNWRLDQKLGVSLGLVGVLGATALFWVVRRKR